MFSAVTAVPGKTPCEASMIVPLMEEEVWLKTGTDISANDRSAIRQISILRSRPLSVRGGGGRGGVNSVPFKMLFLNILSTSLKSNYTDFSRPRRKKGFRQNVFEALPPQKQKLVLSVDMAKHLCTMAPKASLP
jgi:hypothetical protein